MYKMYEFIKIILVFSLIIIFYNVNILFVKQLRKHFEISNAVDASPRWKNTNLWIFFEGWYADLTHKQNCFCLFQ